VPDATPGTPVGPRTIDPDILAVLEYVSAGRGYVDVEPYPDLQARRALGRLHDEGSLRSQASGTPGETGQVTP
jgi:hypothetical protein